MKTCIRTVVPSLIVALALTGCVTNQVTGKLEWNPPKFFADPKVKAAELTAAQVAEKLALEFLLSAIQNKANGGKFDSAWVTSTGLNSLGDAVKDVPNDKAGPVIVKTIQDFTADPSTKPLAQKLAAAYVAANPQTPAEKTATLVGLANGVQSGTQKAVAATPSQ
jgi:hypothetical protein